MKTGKNDAAMQRQAPGAHNAADGALTMHPNDALAATYLLSEGSAQAGGGNAVQDICSLMDDHEAMDALADRLIRTARSGCGSAEDCHALLCSLKGQLQVHLAAEAGFLKPDPAIAAPDPFERELRALKDAFSELSDSWKSYLGRWTAPAIADDRAAFAQETGDMMTALKLRIERENRVTYPMALETGRICLRAY